MSSCVSHDEGAREKLLLFVVLAVPVEAVELLALAAAIRELLLLVVLKISRKQLWYSGYNLYRNMWITDDVIYMGGMAVCLTVTNAFFV